MQLLGIETATSRTQDTLSSASVSRALYYLGLRNEKTSYNTLPLPCITPPLFLDSLSRGDLESGDH